MSRLKILGPCNQPWLTSAVAEFVPLLLVPFTFLFSLGRCLARVATFIRLTSVWTPSSWVSFYLKLAAILSNSFRITQPCLSMVQLIDKPKVISRSQNQKQTTWFSLKSQCPTNPPKGTEKGGKDCKWGQIKNKRYGCTSNNKVDSQHY